MPSFKYLLDKSSKKFICPSCGKRRFVKYIDRQTGNYLDGNYGRCDRSDNCGYFNSPKQEEVACKINCKRIVDFSPKSYKLTDNDFQIHYVPKSMVVEIVGQDVWVKEFFLRQSRIDYRNTEIKVIDDNGSLIHSAAMVEPMPEPEPSFHNHDEVQSVLDLNRECNLSRFLKTKFEESEVDDTLKKYKCHSTNLFWNNSTCFLQVDQNSNIRAGKIMLYSKDNGKRVKQPYPHINWLHNSIQKTQEFNLTQCLFGLHLLNDHNIDKPISIVESEKTAIIMAMVSKKSIWMGCGSKTAINEKMLNPLKSRNIILYADKGSAQDWEEKAEQLKSKGFNIRVSKFLENTDNLELGDDIADLYLNR